MTPTKDSAPNVSALLSDAPEGYAGATNPERAARALGMANGKRYRSLLRDVLGVHVREGDAFDERTRAFMLAVLHTNGTAARVAIGDAYKRGEDAPVAA